MSEGARDRLEAERRFLLDSLDDLDRELAAGDIEADDYIRLRDRYTSRAAVVLEALRANGGARRSAGDGAAAGDGWDGDDGWGDDWDDGGEWPRRPGASRKVLATLLVAAMLAGGASWAVTAAFGERVPGAEATGSVPLTTEEQLALARRHMGEGDAVAAIRAYDAVLEVDPANVEALAYRGWLLRLAGLPDRALEFLDRAVAADPGYPDARFFRGMVLYEDKDDPARGLADLRAFLDSGPPEEVAEAVRAVVARAERDLAARAKSA